MKELIEKLCDVLECEMEKDIEDIDTDEVGKVADIIKDLSEAMYHCTVVEAMENGESIPYVSNTMQKSMV